MRTAGGYFTVKEPPAILNVTLQMLPPEMMAKVQGDFRVRCNILSLVVFVFIFSN